MKFIWEEQDIKVGRKYSRSDINEVWMIGYMAGKSSCGYVSISMDDGLVTESNSKEGLASMLTEEKYIPVEFLSPTK